MAEDNPELRHKLEELDHELEVCLRHGSTLVHLLRRLLDFIQKRPVTVYAYMSTVS